MNTDLISRQGAIDAVNEREWLTQDGKEILAEVIEQLPSAQLEQPIRCKDCKHKHIENKVWTCPFGLPGGPEFFCGYGAKMEVEHDNA